MAAPTITIPILWLEASTMLLIHHPMPMGHQQDDQLVHRSNPLYTLQPLRWAGIRARLFLIYEHTFPTVLQLEQRSRILLCITLPTIARLVTRITMVEISSPRSGRQLPNHKTSAQ